MREILGALALIYPQKTAESYHTMGCESRKL